MPSDIPGDATQPTRKAPLNFSLESFRRPTSRKPASEVQPSPSTFRPPRQSPSSAPQSAHTSSSIAKIDNNASRTIRAAHTILDPAAIIKELVENALDARATRIDVRVRGKGALDTITVSDNGHGISVCDYDSLCLPSTTSKICSFGDLERLSTFGFRGEALSAICAIAKSTTVTTRTATEPVATALKYGNDGALVEQRATARPVGTTLQVEHVFHTLPVRRKDAIKNHTREVSRCVAVVQALALISVNTRIELKVGGEVKVSNLPSMKEPDVIPSSLGKVCLSALRCNAKSVLGARAAKHLVEFSTDEAATVKIPPSARAAMRAEGGDDSHKGPHSKAVYGCHGLISKAALEADGSGGRARSSYQYIFVNRRPVDFPRLTRTIREVYRRATGFNNAAPVAILNLVLPAWSCDVNLAPDKRIVCVHEEDTLIAGILSLLEGMWIPTKTTVIPVEKDSSLDYMIQTAPKVDSREKFDSSEKVDSQAKDDAEMIDIPDESETMDLEALSKGSLGTAVQSHKSHLGAGVEGENKADQSCDPGQPLASAGKPAIHDETIIEDNEDATPAPSEAEPSATPPGSHMLSNSSPRNLSDKSSQMKEASPMQSSINRRLPRDLLMKASAKYSTSKNVSYFIARRKRENSLVPAKRPRSAKFTWPETNRLLLDEKHDQDIGRTNSHEEHETQGADDVDVPPEPVFDEAPFVVKQPTSVATVDVDWDQVCETMTGSQSNEKNNRDTPSETEGQKFKDATLRDIEKEIVNDAHQRAAENEMSRLFHQEWFNELEILGQFNRGFIITKLGKDLFIIDQHASDEKYNFEDLQRNTVISKQRLVQPLALDFSAQDEILVAQHLSAFRAGGFDIEYREQNPPTRRLFLKAQPISKHTMFVQDDLHDIVDMLKSSVVQSSSMTMKVLRPPRIRAMFASRACRKSIMIGTALQKPRMVKVVRHLATLEHPWTCPHGRPTMRHLCSLPS